VTWVDLLRVVVLVLAGGGIGAMLVITWLAFRVLHPPRRPGFLWWHVLTVTLAVSGLVVTTAGERLAMLQQPPDWRLPIALVSMVLLDIALVLIFRIEYERMVDKAARDKVDRER
jgi:hypothetical protein